MIIKPTFKHTSWMGKFQNLKPVKPQSPERIPAIHSPNKHIK